MPLQPQPEHTGGLVFKVSSSDPRRAIKQEGRSSYVVDLSSANGRGVCDCLDYRTRKAKEGNCKHIRLCRDLVAQKVIDHFIKTYGPTQDT